MRVRSAKFVATITSQGVERYLDTLQSSLSKGGATVNQSTTLTGSPSVEWHFPQADNTVSYQFSVGEYGAWFEVTEDGHKRLLDKEVCSEKQLIKLVGRSRSEIFLEQRRSTRSYKSFLD